MNANGVVGSVDSDKALEKVILELGGDYHGVRGKTVNLLGNYDAILLGYNKSTESFSTIRDIDDLPIRTCILYSLSAKLRGNKEYKILFNPAYIIDEERRKIMQVHYDGELFCPSAFEAVRILQNKLDTLYDKYIDEIMFDYLSLR